MRRFENRQRLKCVLRARRDLPSRLTRFAPGLRGTIEGWGLIFLATR
jgi:hypothetical protein